MCASPVRLGGLSVTVWMVVQLLPSWDPSMVHELGRLPSAAFGHTTYLWMVSAEGSWSVRVPVVAEVFSKPAVTLLSKAW